jgi:hypothetical protein
MPSNDRPQRPWRLIARERARETDKGKIPLLSEELNDALLAQGLVCYVPDSDVQVKTLTAPLSGSSEAQGSAINSPSFPDPWLLKKRRNPRSKS